MRFEALLELSRSGVIIDQIDAGGGAGGGERTPLAQIGWTSAARGSSTGGSQVVEPAGVEDEVLRPQHRTRGQP